MGTWACFKAAFVDKDGSMAIPEVVAAFGAFAGITAFVWDWAYRGNKPDLVGLAAFVSGAVLALGTAQRIRDGLFKDGSSGPVDR